MAEDKMISAICWIKRGTTKSFPIFNTGDIIEEENEEMNEETNEDDEEMVKEQKQLQEDAKMQLQDEYTKSIVDQYNLDDYDEEETDVLNGGDSLMYYQDKEDPLIGEVDELEEEDIDDLLIRQDDAVLITAVTEGMENSHVDIMIYEKENNNMYVHHDVMLPAFPLCMEWINYAPPSVITDIKRKEEQIKRINKNNNLMTDEDNNNEKEEEEEHNDDDNDNDGDSDELEKGSLLAIGTFEPGIEIWDLDQIDKVEPVLLLGPSPLSNMRNEKKKNKRKKKKGKNKKKKQPKPVVVEGHTAAVMSISWNSCLQNVLASGSADKTVRLWDLNTQQSINKLTHHSDKVQAVCWHQIEPSMLLTGSYDRSVNILDVRDATKALSYPLNSDIECACWDPHSPQIFYASTEDGEVVAYDARKGHGLSARLFLLAAHNKATSSISLHPSIPNLLVTASVEKSLKFWDISNNKPSLIVKDDNFNERLFAVDWYPDDEELLGVAGKDVLQVVKVFDKYPVLSTHFSKQR